MNLSQMRAQIDRRTGVRQDPLAANAYINEALNTISSRREWPWLDGLQSFPIAGQFATYDVGTDYSETRTLNVGNLEARYLYVADADKFNAVVPYIPSFGYEYIIEWTDGLAQLKILPTPPDGTQVLHRYTRTETLLVNDTDLPLMPERYHSALCDYATGLFLERITPSRADYYMTRAEKEIKDMFEATQRKTNPGRIRIREGYQY